MFDRFLCKIRFCENRSPGQFFLAIKLKFATGAHLENVLDIFSAFFEKLKIFGNIFKNIFSTSVVIYFHF